MKTTRYNLLSSTVIPAVVIAGMAIGTTVLVGEPVMKPAFAACNPCNPCAAAKNPCNPCNPCAAAKNPCNPCNPCAAAKNPCNPCNPCAAANPCNPCNPCAAGAGSASSKCVIPRLQTAAANHPCNPCNPCAAKNPCNPCNPCAAKNPCNPCNPCAAKNPCNPCNPCAASNPCNPCNPCAAGAEIELSDQEATAVYDCLLDEMRAAYAKSDNAVAVSYSAWPRYSTRAYQSGTHGGRFVHNYANKKAEAYGKFEQAGTMAAGGTLVKDSFAVKANGRVSVGPLFLMEKMDAGFNAASDDWRYTLIMPNGATVGTTNGEGTANVQFCIECHKAISDADSMLFIPEEFRGG